MANPISGKFQAGAYARAACNGATLNQAAWDASWMGEDLDTSNFEDTVAGPGGLTVPCTEGVIGFHSSEWSVSGTWDGGINAMDPNVANPPGLYPRYDGSNLVLSIAPAGRGAYPNAQQKFSYGTFRCDQSSVKVTANGKVEFDSKGKNQGGFTTPTTNT